MNTNKIQDPKVKRLTVADLKKIKGAAKTVVIETKDETKVWIN